MALRKAQCLTVMSNLPSEKGSASLVLPLQLGNVALTETPMLDAPLPATNEAPLLAFTGPDNTTNIENPLIDDYENFGMFDDEDNYLMNPDTAVFTNARRVEIILMKLLTELEAPLWAFKEIMDWACDAIQTGYKFIPEQKTYQSQIVILEKWVGMEHMRPINVNIALPGARPDDTISVTTFNFLSQFHSLLSDPLLNVEENLVVNAVDSFTKYESPTGLLNESISGSWYQTAWLHMEQSTECNFMIPIILYIDKTQMSLSGKLSIFPVQMSLAIFTEETRRRASAWRPLGYIANEDYFYLAAERDENSADIKNARFHTQLNVILESFKRAQSPGALHNLKLQLGSTSKVVNLYVPLQYIIGDVEGGDQLCSRYTYRGSACERLCRTCDVSTDNAGRTDLVCNRICVADIQELVVQQNLPELHRLAQRPTFNSLYDIDCGNDPYGIFSMVHTEGLHAIEVGLIPYMLEILMLEISKKYHRRLDKLIKNFLKHPRQHGYKGFPRLLWPDGVTTLTHLTGDLKVGKMFAICCVASTLEGFNFFKKVFPGGEGTWKKMLYVFQQILCYWAWLKQDNYWMASDMQACDEATASIKIMMQQLQSLWPRKAGLEWNLTKLHEQFHIPFDIHRNGKHRNVHTGPQEHNHISIKNAAKKTQLNKRKLDLQTGERIIDRLIIQRAYDRVAPPVNNLGNLPDASPVRNASKGTYEFRSTPAEGQWTAEGNLVWHKPKNSGYVPLLNDSVIALLGTELLESYGKLHHSDSLAEHRALDIPMYTEYERNGFVYRAHPNYRGEHAYYDWAKINWEDGEHPETQEPKVISIIGRILCFFQHPDGSLMAVVHSCRWRTDEQHGVFGTYWHLEFHGAGTNLRPLLHMVPVECLQEHVCMIPYTLTDPYIWIHIWSPNEWPGCFQTIEPPVDVVLAVSDDPVTMTEE